MKIDILKLISIPVLAGVLGILWSLEAIVPLFSLPKNRWLHARRNLSLAAMALVVNTGMGFMTMHLLQYAKERHFGLLQWLHLPIWTIVAISLLVIDLLTYGWHVLSHHVPFLWRFHQVHHTDTYLDVSSSLRNHPLEGVFQVAAQALVLTLLGVPYFAYFIYYFVSSPWVMFAHANVRLPAWLERNMSLVFVTPNWHKVHHSASMPETNSHYGALFSIWDRLFKTAPRPDLRHFQYGLEYFRKDKFQAVKSLLVMPFWKKR